LGEPIVQLRNVTKEYWLGKVRIDALRVEGLEIEKGAFMAVMGPSGSGKTTLLNVIGGLDSPSTGEVIIDGINIADMRERDLAKIRREKIGFVFQFFNLIPTLTAIENVELPMVLQGKYSRSEIRERARSLLELVGLEDRLFHRPTELSGGQQQRVAIARALINDPVLVLADEPTGNIDSATGLQIIQLMSWLNKTRGQTFLIVTHDPKIGALTQRVLYMIDGYVGSYPEPKPSSSSVISDRERKRFLAAELRSLRSSIEHIEKLKKDLPPDLYYQRLSIYEERLRNLADMMKE